MIIQKAGHGPEAGRRARLAGLAGIGLAMWLGQTLPLRAADLPARQPIVVAPIAAAPLPVPTAPPPVLVAPDRVCAPGYALSIEGVCKRTDHLRVRCDGPGGACRPLPPDPLPYGIGPALRPAY